MCDDAVWEDPFTLHFIPDWFVTQQQLKTWDDYHGLYNNDRLIKWYNGYKKRKPQKASVKEELLSILGIHQGIGIVVCQKMRKKETEKLWK